MTKVTQAHIDARTQDILGGARRMFVRKGVDAATMQEIANEAGLSAGAIYRYYPSKAELLRAVCGNWVEKDQTVFERAAVEAQTPLEALLWVGQCVWDEMKGPEAREDTLLMLEAALVAARHEPELEAERRTAIREVVGMVERLVRQAQDAGQIDPQIDAHGLTLMLLTCSFGTRQLALELGDEIDTDTVLAQLGDMLSRFGPRKLEGQEE